MARGRDRRGRSGGAARREGAPRPARDHESRQAARLTANEQPGLVFDRVAEEYDRARPRYPEALVDAACAIAGLRAGSRVLEIGCGTGQLTGALVARGLRVDAVDPGANLVALARRRVGGSRVTFHVGRFEDVELAADRFDAVFSATAFHWVDPAVGWAKVARVLPQGGVFALLAHVGGGTWLELHADVLAAWRSVLPEAVGWATRDPETLWAGAEERRGNVSEVWSWLEKRDLVRPEAAELFGEARVERVPIELEETAEQLVAHVRTQSSYLRLDGERQQVLEERLTAAVERAGGIFRSTLFAVLVTARRRSRRAP